MTGPLSSLKIIEMVGLGPAPLAGQLLADLGAEVIVIDRKSGGNISQEVNRRGKKSIALNLKSKAGIELTLKLITQADVLIEGFRPGVMERLGLSPDECLKVNPKLVYARMTGWGQTGPLSNSAGHDLNYLAITGALHAMGKDGKPPVPPLNLVADYGGGSMFLIMGILSAIIERGISGKGQVIDAAMVDGVPAMMGMIHSMLAQGTWVNERETNFVDGGAPYYRCYTCADGKYLSVGCIEPQFFAEFLKLTSLEPSLSEKQNDKTHWPMLHELFEETIAKKSRDEWASIFERTDACVAPVLDFEEAANYPHNVERKAFFTQNDVTQTSIAPRFDRSTPNQPKLADQTGNETTEILQELGLNENEIKALASDGVLM
jgi:alpha-methylacyl-CoA racemase